MVLNVADVLGILIATLGGAAVGLEREWHSLVLSWRSPNGTYLTTWAFVLEQPEPNRTRLIVRGRVAPGYRPYALPQWLAKMIAPWAHAIMERKQLLGIKRRAETAP